MDQDTLGLHLIPSFYGVYILQSQPKPKCFYVGSTPDPNRRLNQHNGTNVGGAYQTKRSGFRPWKMAVLVHGFPLKISALQFEHALQHPDRTRHISEKLSKSTSIHVKLANIRLLLQCKLFELMDLQITIFNQEIYDIWLKNRYKIDIDNSFDLCEYDQFIKQLDSTNDDFEKLKHDALFNKFNCSNCQTSIDYMIDLDPINTKLDLQKVCAQLPLVTTCCKCNKAYHLTCLARTGDFIPKLIHCECGIELNWKRLVAKSLKLRYYVVKDYLTKVN